MVSIHIGTYIPVRCKYAGAGRPRSELHLTYLLLFINNKSVFWYICRERGRDKVARDVSPLAATYYRHVNLKSVLNYIFRTCSTVTYIYDCCLLNYNCIIVYMYCYTHEQAASTYVYLLARTRNGCLLSLMKPNETTYSCPHWNHNCEHNFVPIYTYVGTNYYNNLWLVGLILTFTYLKYSNN